MIKQTRSFGKYTSLIFIQKKEGKAEKLANINIMVTYIYFPKTGGLK